MNVLIAGFGNIFRSDDGVGCTVARLLASEELPRGVRVRDFGTSGMHLALDMLGEYDLIVIVDAIWRDEPAGTVFAVVCEQETFDAVQPADAHAMTVDAVLALYKRLREQTGDPRERRIAVVGCVPENLDDGMELSEPVRAAIPACIDAVRRLTDRYLAMGAQS